MSKIATKNEVQTWNPTAAETHFAFTHKPWKPESEFDRFDKLTRQILTVPKSDVDALRRKEAD